MRAFIGLAQPVNSDEKYNRSPRAHVISAKVFLSDSAIMYFAIPSVDTQASTTHVDRNHKLEKLIIRAQQKHARSLHRTYTRYGFATAASNVGWTDADHRGRWRRRRNNCHLTVIGGGVAQMHRRTDGRLQR